MKKTYLIAFSCFAFLITVITSCGIYTYVSLLPPKDFSAPSTSMLELLHQLENNDGSDRTFLGYEIFYRAYDSWLAANADIVTLNSYANSSYSDDPVGFIDSAKMSLGFVRLRKYTNTTDTSPLVTIVDASPEAYYLELNSDKDWIISADISTIADDIVLARNINIDYSTRYSFAKASNYQNGDADYEGSDSPSTVYFVFFACAFGTDPTSFTNLYSTPVLIRSYITYNPGL